MTVLFLIATLQAPNWVAMPESVTVGDTVRISRRVPAEAGVRVRVPALEASDVLQPLSAPRWSYADGTVLISYQLSLFRVGVHDVTLPEFQLVYPDGRIVQVLPSTVTLEVRSVLPDSASGSKKISYLPHSFNSI